LQGFLWALLSGASEPLGALMGYLVLDGNNSLSFAIVFGLVAGQLVPAGVAGYHCLPALPRCLLAGRQASCNALPGTPLVHLSGTPLYPTTSPPYRFVPPAGMMVYISVRELIPTALRYDPQDSVATACVVAGMVVMGLSLVLFTL